MIEDEEDPSSDPTSSGHLVLGFCRMRYCAGCGDGRETAATWGIEAREKPGSSPSHHRPEQSLGRSEARLGKDGTRWTQQRGDRRLQDDARHCTEAVGRELRRSPQRRQLDELVGRLRTLAASDRRRGDGRIRNDRRGGAGGSRPAGGRRQSGAGARLRRARRQARQDGPDRRRRHRPLRRGDETAGAPPARRSDALSATRRPAPADRRDDRRRASATPAPLPSGRRRASPG